MKNQIAKMIDHTMLKPEATIDEIRILCEQAKAHGFYSVCINPYWIPNAKKILEGSTVKLCTVIGFPFGATLPQVKVHETTSAVAAGADEVDLVINIGAARENHWDFIEHEIHMVVSAAHGRTVKVILEICYLKEEQIEEACRRAVRAGAHYVKTSTGFGPGGATVEAVKLMRKAVGKTFGVKASGGIKDRATAEAMIAAGASRLGCSSSLTIIQSIAERG